ncbi:MAG TPA: tripartite tricarboxylate transporter substrate binding protein [Burkholderiales bacterium]|nr:tripartite tricarboxylate transporter substrate binding protein [Burkholderiales bacterium]
MRLVTFLVTLFAAASVCAQSYPTKPIRLLVGYPPGGSGDFLTRLMADEMSRDLGVAVVAENRPGAGGVIASDVVAKSPADGYTVLNAGHHAISKALYKKLPFDPDKDFAPVTLVAVGPTIICVNNSLPATNLRELIAYAKANPGKLFNASAGYGSAPHLASVSFETAAGVKFTSIQFKGGGPAAQSLLSGDTQVMFSTPPTVMGFIRAGRMRALAITMPRASPAVPGIPGAEEAGLSGYESTFWFGLYVPAGTPAAVIKRLHEAGAKALTKPEVRDKMALQGMVAAPSASPEAFEARIRAEAPMWERVVRDSGAQVE